jgi:hypothetical protein
MNMGVREGDTSILHHYRVSDTPSAPVYVGTKRRYIDYIEPYSSLLRYLEDCVPAVPPSLRLRC